MRTILLPLTDKSSENSYKLSFCLNDEGIVTISGKKRVKKVHGVNVTDLSIVKHIPFDESLSQEDIFVLAYLAYLYTLRVVDTRTMRRLTKVPRQVVTDTKDNIFRSYDIVRYKIATLRCVYRSLTPKNPREVEQQFLACGLKATDAVLYYLMYDNNDIQTFVKSIETMEDTKFVLSINTLERELETDIKINKEFEKTAAYFTWKTLMFIVYGNNFTFEDIRNDLKTHAIQSYYWVRPFYSKLHAINYAKNSIRGYTQVLIDYYNKEDRRRIFATENGYDNVIRDLTPDIVVYDNAFDVEEQIVEYLDEKLAYR